MNYFSVFQGSFVENNTFFPTLTRQVSCKSPQIASIVKCGKINASLFSLCFKNLSNYYMSLLIGQSGITRLPINNNFCGMKDVPVTN